MVKQIKNTADNAAMQEGNSGIGGTLHPALVAKFGEALCDEDASVTQEEPTKIARRNRKHQGTKEILHPALVSKFGMLKRSGR